MTRNLSLSLRVHIAHRYIDTSHHASSIIAKSAGLRAIAVGYGYGSIADGRWHWWMRHCASLTERRTEGRGESGAALHSTNIVCVSTLVSSYI